MELLIEWCNDMDKDQLNLCCIIDEIFIIKVTHIEVDFHGIDHSWRNYPDQLYYHSYAV